MSGPFVLGIDADTHRVAWSRVSFAWTGGGQGKVVVESVGTVLRAGRDGVVASRYRGGLEKVLSGGVPEAIYIETPVLMRYRGLVTSGSVEDFEALCRITGELLYCWRAWDVPIELVEPDAWHRVVLGFSKGRAELKVAMGRAAVELFGREVTEHEADAIGVGYFGLGELLGDGFSAEAGPDGVPHSVSRRRNAAKG